MPKKLKINLREGLDARHRLRLRRAAARRNREMMTVRLPLLIQRRPAPNTAGWLARGIIHETSFVFDFVLLPSTSGSCIDGHRIGRVADRRQRSRRNVRRGW